MTTQNEHLITREIGIDMGHRVTYHGSKCRNLHGHRYTIEATVRGPLFSEGEQQGMVLDYGFLKDIMISEIDRDCDHGMTLWVDDPWVDVLCNGQRAAIDVGIDHSGYCDLQLAGDETNTGGKFYIVPFVPTAENLAKHWFERLEPKVSKMTNGQGKMHSVKVWETPNCAAIYPVRG